MTLGGVVVVIVQVAFVVGCAPLGVGLFRTVRARLEGRVGPPIVQPWRDLRKLWAKERIAPEHTKLGLLGGSDPARRRASLVIAMILPLASTASPLDHVGDLFAVVSLFLVGTFVLALAGLDPGTAFGGMGASREMTVAALAEPTLLLAVFAISGRAGSSNLASIVTATLHAPRTVVSLPSLLALVALAIAALAECGRMPVDNPSTHLELTMIHEAMVLEYAGPDLALVELAAVDAVVAVRDVARQPVRTVRHRDDHRVVGGRDRRGRPRRQARVRRGRARHVRGLYVAKIRLFRVPELLAVSFVVAFLAVTASSFLDMSLPTDTYLPIARPHRRRRAGRRRPGSVAPQLASDRADPGRARRGGRDRGARSSVSTVARPVIWSSPACSSW